MENLKIKVNNEAESGEAQALLLRGGYKLERLNKYEYPQYVAFNPAEMTFKNYVMDAYVPLLWKEITLSALRNMITMQHKENLKIRVHTEDQVKTAIGLAEKLGYKEKYPKSFKLTDGYICLDGDKDILKACISQAGAELDEFKEISIEELRTMTTPQHKEYLDPQNNYELIEWDGGFMIQDHWIEVPMGAEILSSFNNGQSLIFHKQDLNYVVGTDEDWNKLGVSYEYFRSYFPLAVILWQRNAGKEYLDPTDSYKLIKTPSPMSHWIEVPEGAELYMMTSAHAQRGIFYKKGWYEFLEAYERSNWKQTGYSNKNYKSEMLEKGCALVWQRDAQTNAMNADADSEVHSSADELFSSILGTTAWDTQVGGNHYKQFKIQPMQFALENNLDAAQHNVIKYVMRHSSKNGKEDLEKAKHYIDLMIQHYYGAQ